MKKVIITTLAIVFSLSIFAQSQQQTTYEKKKEELVRQITRKFGQQSALQIVALHNINGDDKFIADVGLIKSMAALSGQKTPPELEAMLWYAEELKKAQKLKTSVDFQREKEANYPKTDAGKIQKDIKAAFEKWNKRGEFEKQSDYEERLQNQSKNAFVQICVEQIKNKLPKGLDRKLQPYDIDKELFVVNFEINSIKWQSSIMIPLANAESFKNKWQNLETEINQYDWSFFDNSLCPTKVIMLDKTDKYEFISPSQSLSEITYSFDDLEIENPHLKSFTFRYSEAKAIELKIAREKFVSDSLEMVTYNNKLETAFQYYNRQLSENKYNIEKNVISNYIKIPMGENKERNYDNSLNSLKRDYDRINSELENTFNRSYSDAREFFSTKEDFEKFYTQGKDVLNEEVAKRKEKQEEENILNFFKSNAKFIESMDFQKEKKESTASIIGKGLYGVATGTDVSTMDYSKENDARKKILSAISENQNKSYLSQILDFVVETNKELNKEWSKNGQYFNSKSDFYNAFLSENYKQILEDNKKR